jgi:hypothetical protein
MFFAFLNWIRPNFILLRQSIKIAIVGRIRNLKNARNTSVYKTNEIKGF